MMVTVHLSDGRKITKDEKHLKFFTGETCRKQNVLPPICEGYITINFDHVVDMRPAERDEIEHAEIHGW